MANADIPAEALVGLTAGGYSGTNVATVDGAAKAAMDVRDHPSRNIPNATEHHDGTVLPTQGRTAPDLNPNGPWGARDGGR